MSRQLSDNDRIRLQHMLDAAREAISFATGKTKLYYEHERQLQLALVHLIQTIGEAASRVSNDVRNTLPLVPWKDVIGMRNVLVHAYFDVELDTVWKVVQQDLPVLIVELERALDSRR